MAKKTTKDPEIGNPTVSPAEGCDLVRELKQNAETLVGKGRVTHEEEQAWQSSAEQSLTEAFGRDHPMIHRVVHAQASRPFNIGMSPDEKAALRSEEMAAKVMQLSVALQTLERHAARPGGRPGNETPSPKTVINTFNGPVGSVQSGDHNLANTVLSVGPDVEQLMHVIADLRRLAERFDPSSRTEADEHLNDIAVELQGEKKPSRLKAALRSLGDFAGKSVEFGAKVGALAEIAQKLGLLPK